MTPAPSSAAPNALRYAWFVVALLFPVALLNYLDRQMIAAMKSSVMRDIPTIGSDANWGYMLGQFKWVYAILSPIGGYIADRFSRRFTIGLSLFCWSAITFATGKVTTYDGLLWTRTLMGISEAFYIPAALALIADLHSTGTRSRAVGLHQIGIYLGVITGSFAGYAADAPTLGWRWMFDCTGLIGILYALPLVWFLRDARRETSATSAVPGGQGTRLSPLAALGELLGNGSFILLVLYFTLPALAGWVVRDWMPAILQKELNLKQGIAGVSAVVYWQGAAIVSAIAGGWLADRWMRRTARGRIYVSATGMGCIIPAMLGVGIVVSQGSLPLAVMFLILFGIGWGLFDGNNMPILSQIVRPELRATGYGIMNLVSISCGGFADWGFGALRDRHVPLNLIFGVFAGVAVISVVLVLLIKPRSEERSAASG